MKNELTIFENPEFGKVRTVVINNEPYFVGKDVAEALGYERGAKAIADHVDNEDKDVIPIRDSIGRMQNTPIINESGVYSLVFGSKLETAKKFKRWVTSEVLPAIRKTGSYNLPATYLDALKALVTSEEQRLLAESKVEEMTPKAEFYDEVTESPDTMDMKAVAKVLNYPHIGRTKLFEFLRNKGVLNKDNEPYQLYIDKGYFRQIETQWKQFGTTKINRKTVVFQKGVDFIRKLLRMEYPRLA